ncbi:MAG: type II toxin-antitoxin system HicB family antitoxin [Chloroflexota bacterium]
MCRFLVIIEKTKNNYSAYSPDLQGCVATGKTRDEVALNMHEAFEMHMRGLIEDNLPIPKPDTEAEYIAIRA